MDVLQVVFLLLIWGIPITFSIRSFRKTTERERDDLMRELKMPCFYLELGLYLIGILVLFTGSISEVKWLGYTGAVLLIVGGLNAVIGGWVRREVRLIPGIWAVLWIIAFIIAFYYLR